MLIFCSWLGICGGNKLIWSFCIVSGQAWLGQHILNFDQGKSDSWNFNNPRKVRVMKLMKDTYEREELILSLYIEKVK